MAQQRQHEPAVGVPYYGGAGAGVGPNPNYYYPPQHPHQNGMIPSNVIVGDPKGVPIQQTIFRDTPAPFNCLYCGESALTTLKSKPSLAALVGCMIPFCLGCCFLCLSMDCLWHKYHYCPGCGEKVADFKKTDVCAVMDPPNWVESSFAVPA